MKPDAGWGLLLGAGEGGESAQAEERPGRGAGQAGNPVRGRDDAGCGARTAVTEGPESGEKQLQRALHYIMIEASGGGVKGGCSCRRAAWPDIPDPFRGRML